MKKLLSVLMTTALATGASWMLASCDDDNSKGLDNPFTSVEAADWTFTSDAYQDVCIGEIKTRDDNPEITAYSTSEDVEVAVSKAGTDDGLNIYRVYVSLPERTKAVEMQSKVMIEAVGGTDERVYKEVNINQYGSIRNLGWDLLSGTYTLTGVNELDPEDGDSEVETDKAMKLTFSTDGQATVSDLHDIDLMYPHTGAATLDGNKISFGSPTRTFTVASAEATPQGKRIVLEYREGFIGSRVTEYEQYVFQEVK